MSPAQTMKSHQQLLHHQDLLKLLVMTSMMDGTMQTARHTIANGIALVPTVRHMEMDQRTSASQLTRLVAAVVVGIPFIECSKIEYDILLCKV